MSEHELQNKIEDEIRQLIVKKISELNRRDLFREPLVGFSRADDTRYEQLKSSIGEWHKNPAELFPEAVSVISYFVPFTRDVAFSPKNSMQETPAWGESYAVINSYFDKINSAIKNYLETKGFQSYTIAATHTYNEADMKSMWSHRSAAAIAGLGKFGANRMLITPKGSAGRFSTVLTSAFLNPSQPIADDLCPYKRNKSCGLCFKICPVHALQSDGINRFACQAETRKNERLLELNAGIYNADTCGKCVSVCPYAYIK